MTAGVKDDSAKLRLDLVPVGPLLETAKVYTEGAKKYADRNWELGMKYSRMYAAMMRHALAFWNGEDTHLVVEGDESSRCHHLASVVFCANAMMEYAKTHPEFDDRPGRGNLIRGNTILDTPEGNGIFIGNWLRQQID